MCEAMGVVSRVGHAVQWAHELDQGRGGDTGPVRASPAPSSLVELVGPLVELVEVELDHELVGPLVELVEVTRPRAPRVRLRARRPRARRTRAAPGRARGRTPARAPPHTP